MPTKQVCKCGAEMERSSVVLAAGSICCARMAGTGRASAGQDLVGGIDHGPGSNQPVHHLQLAIQTSKVERSRAVLRRTSQQEVGRESEEQPGVPRRDLGCCHAMIAQFVA